MTDYFLFCIFNSSQKQVLINYDYRFFSTSHYWGNIYGDSALDGTDPAYPCGYAFFGPDRMVFGTDYPYGLEEGEDFIRENLASVKKMNIGEEDKKKILGENAKKLLKIR